MFEVLGLTEEEAKEKFGYLLEAFRYGVAAGAASVMTDGTQLVRKADFCGIYTGKKVDKFERCGFTKQMASAVSCPLIEESPMSLECKVKQIIPLGTHDMFLAEIVAVDIAPELIDEKGKLRLERARLTAFAHGEYFEVGRKIDDFGCSVKAKKSKGKKPAQDKKA